MLSFFFFEQKTAYEMRISDWSSDVCSSDLLAVHAENRRAHLLLNELAEIRAEVLAGLFGDCAVTRYDAAHIHDHLDAGLVPSVVLMNPPFSAVAHVDRMMKDAALRHIRSEEHTSELQSLMRTSYAVFCLK